MNKYPKKKRENTDHWLIARFSSRFLLCASLSDSFLRLLDMRASKEQEDTKMKKKATTTMSEMRKRLFLCFSFFFYDDLCGPMDESQEKNCKHSSSLHGHVPDIVSFNFLLLFSLSLCVHYFLPITYSSSYSVSPQRVNFSLCLLRFYLFLFFSVENLGFSERGGKMGKMIHFFIVWDFSCGLHGGYVSNESQIFTVNDPTTAALCNGFCVCCHFFSCLFFFALSRRPKVFSYTRLISTVKNYILFFHQFLSDDVNKKKKIEILKNSERERGWGWFYCVLEGESKGAIGGMAVTERQLRGWARWAFFSFVCCRRLLVDMRAGEQSTFLACLIYFFIVLFFAFCIFVHSITIFNWFITPQRWLALLYLFFFAMILWSLLCMRKAEDCIMKNVRITLK